MQSWWIGSFGGLVLAHRTGFSERSTPTTGAWSLCKSAVPPEPLPTDLQGDDTVWLRGGMASILFWIHCKTAGKIYCPSSWECGDASDKTTIGRSRAPNNIWCPSSFHWHEATTPETNHNIYPSYTPKHLNHAATTKPTSQTGTVTKGEKECPWKATLGQERWQRVQLKEVQTLACCLRSDNV